MNTSLDSLLLVCLCLPSHLSVTNSLSSVATVLEPAKSLVAPTSVLSRLSASICPTFVEGLCMGQRSLHRMILIRYTPRLFLIPWLGRFPLLVPRLAASIQRPGPAPAHFHSVSAIHSSSGFSVFTPKLLPGPHLSPQAATCISLRVRIYPLSRLSLGLGTQVY